MKSDREPFSEGDASDASDAMLDELLAQARWPEPGNDAQARLRHGYLRAAGGSLRLFNQPRASARGSKVVRAVIGIAAMIMIVIGVWIGTTQKNNNHVAIVPPIAPVNPTPEVKKTAPEPFVRPLGPVERLVLIEDKQRLAQRTKSPPQAVKPDSLATLRRLDNAALVRVASAATDMNRRDNAIRLLLERNDLQSFLYFVLRPNTRAEALAVLHEMPNPPTNELLAELNHRQVDYRLAAAKALGGLCDRKIDRTLMTMVATNNHRREAIAALLSCSDPHAKQLITQAQAYASADEIRSVQRDLNQTF